MATGDGTGDDTGGETGGNCITDVPGVAVGNAHDDPAKTGVTVILPDEAAICACDVRGGGPGTRETDALGLAGLVDRADAVVLAGGSVYGLGAADGVAAVLGGSGRGFSLIAEEHVPPSPIVPAAILYDLANGGDKAWGEYPPYGSLGREAVSRASKRAVALGPVGAGRGATAGAYRGGLGSASWTTPDGWTVGAIVAVNSFGSPYVPGTDQFWAAPFEQMQEFGGRGTARVSGVADFPPDTKIGVADRRNTTIAVVATDAPLTKQQLKRVAIMAQDGLARAIRPAHGPTDGDVVFALSTGAGEAVSLPAVMNLGTLAGDVLARAIARGVFAAEG